MIKIIDIDLLRIKPRFIPVWATVEAKERYLWKDKEVDVFRVEIRKKRTQTIPTYVAYVTEEGELLEMNFSLGKLPLRIVLEEHWVEDD
jgi:hypothetical protein